MDRERLTKREVQTELRDENTETITVKRIANNTFEILYSNGDKAIRYHHTDIITYKPNGDIILNTDGWKTNTTKERMGFLTQKSSYRIIQENKVWYLLKDSHPFDWKTCQRWTYRDRMIIHPNGEIEGAEVDSKELLKLNKSILKYVDGYIKVLLDRKIPKPSRDDCWGCYMKDEKTGKPAFGNDHLIYHMKEKYYVPSLLMNAIEVFPVSIIATSEIGYLLGYHDQTAKWGKDLIKFQIRSSLRRYMQRQLGLAV